jgi:hypothetical protein
LLFPHLLSLQHWRLSYAEDESVLSVETQVSRELLITPDSPKEMFEARLGVVFAGKIGRAVGYLLLCQSTGLITALLGLVPCQNFL